VTGGAGYFGSTLVDELLREDYEVDVVDRLNYGDSGVEPYVKNRRYHFHEFDILDVSELKRVLRKADCIVHLAALVGDPLCSKYPEEAWRVNVEGTQGLVELAKDEHLPLILASTCSNYGVTAGWALESTPLNPQGIYAKSKVEAERLVSQLYFHTILRFSTLFGVSPRMRMDLMLNEWTKNLLFDKRVEVYQPNAHRPIIHVRDASRAIKGVLNGLQFAQNQVFNVGCNDYNFTKQKLAELIRDEVSGEIVTVEKGDPRDYLVSFDKIRQVYGFYPRFHPTEGVREVKAFLESYSGAKTFNNVVDYHDSSL